MINFFRKIRQSLLAEGKTGKYLKYAVGEIVLVVIGILIALQINNWNEELKDTKREKLVLKEFKTSIDKDLRLYEDNYTWRLERKKKGLDSLLYYIKNDNNIPDTLFKAFYGMMSQNILITYDEGPYEALKSVGLEIIRNDSLRTAINRTYTRLPKLIYFAHSNDAERYSMISSLENKISNIKTFKYQDDRISAEYEIKVDQILTNQNFLRIYDLQANKYDTYTYRLKQIKSDLIDLKKQIEEELKK